MPLQRVLKSDPGRNSPTAGGDVTLGDLSDLSCSQLQWLHLVAGRVGRV